MELLRRLAPLLSTLLVALVAVQTTDLVACADEAATATGQAEGYHVDGPAAAGAHPTPSPGDSHDEGAPHEETPGMADCLCHVVFTPVAHLPEVTSAPAAEPAAYATYVTPRGAAHAKPLDHVPLA